MSRRKQENPQPRKSLVTAETDHIQDTLTCGVCQKDFSLSDIVKFIQHKVHTCNKENCLIFEDGDSDVDTETNKQVVGAKRPSISAPITRRDGDLLSRKDIKRNAAILPRPSSAMEVDTNCVDDENIRCHSLSDITPPNSEDNGEKDELQERMKSPKTKEGDVNTTNSEPKSYVCSTCRQTFESAWLLVQHVQNLHGIKIYIETASNSSNGNTISHSVTSSPLSSKEQTSPHQTTQERASSLQILRVPLVEKQFGPSLNCHSLFSRPSSQDFIGDQFQRLNNHTGLGLSSLDGSQTAFERTTRGPSLSLGFEPQMDFYSQRLRQLAGATSPNSAASPRKLLTPSFTSLLTLPPSQPSTPSTTPQPTGQQPQQQQQSSSSSSTSSKASDQQTPISPKLKSCEFCGKSFRFQSNLIVHRRSHTGEKPFKCHICNHACSQASKLKRHMKTHRNKSPGESVVSENNSVESSPSTPDSTKGKEEKQTNGEDYHSDGQGGDNEEEEDDEDEDEEEEEEAELEEEDMEEEVEHLETDGGMVAEDLTTRGPNSSTPVLVSNAEDAGGGEDDKKKEEKDECDKPILRHSLLSEVMEKIGLAQIQQYNEAFKQALQESSGKALIKQERQSSGGDAGSSASNEGNAEDGHERPNRDGNKSSGHSPVNFSKSLLGAFDQSMNSNKRIKSELGEHWRDRESLYAGLWLPTLTSTYRDIYLGMSPGSDTDSPRLKASSESALFLASAVGGSLSPRPGTSGTGGGGSSGGGATTTNNSDSTTSTTPSSLSKTKDHRRNDTCEYCGKVFKNCSNLTVHRRSHTGEKPYKCELCSYACAQSSKLTRHMKTHGRIGKDVYRCRFCEMPFSVPSTLEKHMRKCVVQNSSVVLSERDSDSKEMS